MTAHLVYIPRGINAPRPGDIRSADLRGCINAKHAADRSLAYERRTGARVLTVRLLPGAR